MLLLATGCSEPPPYRNQELPGDLLTIRINRMDQDVFRGDYERPNALRDSLTTRYGSFYCTFVEDILRAGPCGSDSTISALRGFATWPDMVELQKAVEERFPPGGSGELESSFSEALSRWHHHFPDSVVPRVVWMNSGLNYSAHCSDSVMACGLDYFIGSDHPLMDKLPPELFPQYLKDDMQPSYALPNTVKDFCQYEVSQCCAPAERPDLLGLLIFHGKVMYLADLLVPDVADSVKMNWSSGQMEWAMENEWNVWKELAVQEVMFSTHSDRNVRWFDFGPFTNAPHIPQDSPPQLGIWMGWKMVRAYVDEHPETPVHRLLREISDREFLQAYRPRKVGT